MPRVLPELHIEIKKLGNRYIAITQREDGRTILENEFHHDPTGLTHLGPLWLLDRGQLNAEEARRFESQRKQGKLSTQVAAYGWRLYRYLFGDGKALYDYLQAEPAYQQAHVVLMLGASARPLWRLPWEYLYDGRSFPCLTGAMLISRRPIGVQPLPASATAGPLRLLVVIAGQGERTDAHVEAALGELQDALDDVIRLGRVQMDVLSEATVAALREVVHQETYNVIHYIGHGIYNIQNRQGYLGIESPLGRTELVSGTQLGRYIKGRAPQLFVISTYGNHRVGLLDAFNNVASDLLQHNVPNVLTIPTNLEPDFFTAFYGNLYLSLSEGNLVIESLAEARKAAHAVDDRLPNGDRQLNWGVPMLYQRTSSLRSVAPRPGRGMVDYHEYTVLQSPPATALLGRRGELQTVRQALQVDAPVEDDDQAGYARTIFIWGSDGVGRSVFVRRLLKPNGYKPATLTLRCQEEPEPLAVLTKIVEFWRTYAPDTSASAAKLLLDTNQPPLERAREAQEILGKHTFHILIEDVDAWFLPETGTAAPGAMADGTMRDILLGLLSAKSKSVFVLTSTRRWQGLTTLPKDRRREIYLSPLSERYAIQFMNRWPHLRAMPLREKHAVFWHVGGHPKTLEYLAAWLALGHDLTSAINLLPTATREPEAWLDYYLDGILESLDPGEYDVLATLAVLSISFSVRTVSKLTPVTRKHARPLLAKWQRLGLIEVMSSEDASPDALQDADVMQDRPELTYNLHTTLQKAMIRRISPEEIVRLHQQIARYYSAPFVDAARRQVLSRNITRWSENRIAWLARDTNGILGVRLRQDQDEGQKAQIIQKALAWQHHLIGAKQYQEAVHVIQTIAPELNGLGYRDLSKALLQRGLSFVEHLETTMGMDVLAKLRMEEGHLEAALQVYEDVYQSLNPEQAKLQRAHVLMRAGSVYQRLGDLETAQERFERALAITREIEDREGEAECLYELSVTMRQAHDYRSALVYSQAAKEHYEGLAYSFGLTVIEHEQGHILRAMGRPESALERYAASLGICRKLDDQQCMADNLLEIGQLFHELGNTKMAIKALEEALEIYDYLSSPKVEIVKTLLDKLGEEVVRRNES